MRYRSLRTGRLVAPDAVRRALDLALQNNASKARNLAEQLRSGAIDIDEWALAMRGVVKDTQLFSSAAARGGWAQMGAHAFGLVGQRVRRQYAFLTNLTIELRAGLPKDGRFLERAASYAKAAKPAFLAARQDVVQLSGFDEIKTDLNPAEHCDDCIREAARGFVRMGTEVPIGARQCLHNDRCSVRFRNSQTGEVVTA